ncbi:2-keto-4-pentenoate hydratase/2-oxohepta-3-ene-1,7-dioic acid hydratase in catechol pathway [Caldalkalibacillus uzonensis]|uniref:2-keto-4-pentenoate hydratase/2-oxohepta-3-ene-1,7-dioic acid hydratase in catechol pathway n=1 Tax=Caldalkalibacillus uzonensis TaxID=353224 RepID=A0ABU0CPL8_9BACI|nr:fumarylacetoacetate hydrolase family protein [Caldalkalibacillus uzonensis]MDQ0338362.1 2-keto-4-pentenoate hydratase/2-oxohepta-3-ene-1,7-dioic acid hydratase in catechol pathway [Caldalkalibacillus uzonensis]
MGYHLVRYQHQGRIKWGIVKEEIIYEITGTYDTLASFLRTGVDEAKNILSTKDPMRRSFAEVEILSPVTEPAQIVCQGANYGAHREEAGLTGQRPPFNLIFTKASSSMVGAYHDIYLPDHVQLLDYEIEVGLVIGKEITEPIKVTIENLHQYVVGVVLGNDISARDIQLAEGQWFKGKSFRTFCPVGPFLYLFDQDEAHYIHNLELTLSVNGQVRQTSNTAFMLYKPEETLTHLSQIMNLYPGDLLLTGTPGGVALKLTSEELETLWNPFAPYDEKMELIIKSQKNNPDYLKVGDVIKCTAKSTDGKINLGTQENRIVRKS